MKTVVITGSSRGLGFEMAQRFRKNGLNVVINGVHPTRLEKAKAALEEIESPGAVLACAGNVVKAADIQNIIDRAVERIRSQIMGNLA